MQTISLPRLCRLGADVLPWLCLQLTTADWRALTAVVEEALLVRDFPRAAAALQLLLKAGQVVSEPATSNRCLGPASSQ